MTRRIVVSVVIAATLLATAAVGSASASPVRNDTFKHAAVISSLPFNTTLDTTRATVDQTDEQAATTCGVNGQFDLAASVWYAYTPATDQTVTVDASGYNIGLGVFTGTPSNFSGFLCATSGGEFQALAGQTYYIDVVGLNGHGGTLNLSVTGNPTPAAPSSKAQCNKGGWRSFPQFKNQGACVRSIAPAK